MIVVVIEVLAGIAVTEVKEQSHKLFIIIVCNSNSKHINDSEKAIRVLETEVLGEAIKASETEVLENPTTEDSDRAIIMVLDENPSTTDIHVETG